MQVINPDRLISIGWIIFLLLLAAGLIILVKYCADMAIKQTIHCVNWSVVNGIAEC